jgi:hypothetical protein
VWHKTSFENWPRRKQMVSTAIKNNNQAIFIGGIDPDQDHKSAQNWRASMDEWAQGIAVFDMNKLELKDNYDADAPPYAAPDLVKATYENG